jgi:hypothetical protein
LLLLLLLRWHMYVLWSFIADAATHIVCAVAAANEHRLLVLSLLMMLRIDIGLG